MNSMFSQRIIICLAVLIWVCCYTAHAQTDSLSVGQKLLKENQTSKLRKALRKLRSGGKEKLLAAKDSLDSIPKGKTDSLKTVLRQTTQPATDLKQKVGSGIDSTKAVVMSPVNNAKSKVSSIQQKVNSTTDSILSKINRPINNVNNGINGTYDSLAGKANDAIKTVTQPFGLETGKFPGLDKEPGSVPKLDVKDVDALKIVPDVKQPSLPGIPGNDKVQEVKDLPGEKLKSITEADKLRNVQGKVQDLDSKLERVEKLEDDAKNVAKGNIDQVKQAPEELERQLVARSGIKETEKYMSKLEQQRAMLEKYKDRKLVEQEIRNKTLNLANDKLGHQLEPVKKADEKLDKKRKAFGNFQSIKNIPKRPVNEMKRKPFRQRLVPGITLHFFQTDNKKLFDVGLQGGYKLNNRFVAGLGGIYRVAVSKNYNYYVSNYGMYGGRLFTEITLAKGFMAHADFEYLSLSSRYYPGIEALKANVLQSNFGLGKSFQISKRIRGSALGLYRVEYSGTLPGQPKFTMRVGFELTPKKKRHQKKVN